MDVALQDRDVWMVGRVQSEAFREGLTQASLTASAYWIIVAPGCNAMSMAVMGFCSALDVSA